jgi:hypothetical protein
MTVYMIHMMHISLEALRAQTSFLTVQVLHLTSESLKGTASVGGRIGASQHWREPICTSHVKIDNEHIARELLDAGNGYEGDTARGK